MDYFFSRFSHPHMSVEDGIIFNGNVVDPEGKPFHIELTINGEKQPKFCELSVTSSDSSWYAISTIDYDFKYIKRKLNPLRKSTSKFTQLLSAEVIIRSYIGQFYVEINDTTLTIIDTIPF